MPSPVVDSQLPLLETLQIASPCSADWNEMQGDERMRFCSHCQQNVFNLWEMTRSEAENFVRERTGSICVRMYKRADGTVLTRDCPIGLAKVRQRIARWFVISSTIAATLVFGTLTACGSMLGLTNRKNTGFNNGIFTRYLPEDPDKYIVMGGCPAPPITFAPPPVVTVPVGINASGE